MDLKHIKTFERGNDDFPKRLEKLPDPPDRIYVAGRLTDAPAIAIVGSRNADPGACRFTARIAGDLAQRGFSIISGGALGVDTAAHRGALDAGGVTLSVIGSGFGFLYPEANEPLFSEIVKTGGLMTELHPDQPPTKWTFPKRNRLVAALADAVLVVQAGARSGALITANWAERLDTPVGAVPGIPDDQHNRGNHALLKRGARLIEDADDIEAMLSRPDAARQLDLPLSSREATPAKLPPRGALSPLEVKILDILCTSPLHIDDITTRLGTIPSETGAAMLTLELQGLVEDRGGKHYVRVG